MAQEQIEPKTLEVAIHKSAFYRQEAESFLNRAFSVDDSLRSTLAYCNGVWGLGKIDVFLSADSVPGKKHGVEAGLLVGAGKAQGIILEFFPGALNWITNSKSMYKLLLAHEGTHYARWQVHPRRTGQLIDLIIDEGVAMSAEQIIFEEAQKIKIGDDKDPDIDIEVISQEAKKDMNCPEDDSRIVDRWFRGKYDLPFLSVHRVGIHWMGQYRKLVNPTLKELIAVPKSAILKYVSNFN